MKIKERLDLVNYELERVRLEMKVIDHAIIGPDNYSKIKDLRREMAMNIKTVNQQMYPLTNPQWSPQGYIVSTFNTRGVYPTYP